MSGDQYQCRACGRIRSSNAYRRHYNRANLPPICICQAKSIGNPQLGWWRLVRAKTESNDTSNKRK